jgi:hypothetical protein
VKRRLFTALSAVSLLLCVASLVVWYRSYFVTDEIVWLKGHDGNIGEQAEENRWYARSWSGGFLLASIYERWNMPEGRLGSRHNIRWATRSQFPPHADPVVLFFGPIRLRYGFGAASRSFVQPPYSQRVSRLREIEFPTYASTILTAILPALWIVRRLPKQRRGQVGLCRTCGYDLRASTERCPECGTAIPKTIGPLP